MAHRGIGEEIGAHEQMAEVDADNKKKLSEAIDVVKMFVDDNHEFIEFYNNDAGLK